MNNTKPIDAAAAETLTVKPSNTLICALEA